MLNKMTKLTSESLNLMKNKFMIKSDDSINPQFELDEMDFPESKIEERSEVFDKISDAAKTFRNLRNQLITKSNTDKMNIKNQIIHQSRNNAMHQVNSLSPKLGTEGTPMFKKIKQ